MTIWQLLASIGGFSLSSVHTAHAFALCVDVYKRQGVARLRILKEALGIAAADLQAVGVELFEEIGLERRAAHRGLSLIHI